MTPRAVLLLPLLLGACASMDAHRAHCAALLGRVPAPVADDKTEPGGPITAADGAKPGPVHPAIEACAVQRAESERANVATGVLAAVLLVAAAGIAGASYRGRATAYRAPAYRTSYRAPYRAPYYRRSR